MNTDVFMNSLFFYIIAVVLVSVGLYLFYRLGRNNQSSKITGTMEADEFRRLLGKIILTITAVFLTATLVIYALNPVNIQVDVSDIGGEQKVIDDEEVKAIKNDLIRSPRNETVTIEEATENSDKSFENYLKGVKK